MNDVDPLREAAAVRPDTTAVIETTTGTELSYASLDHEVALKTDSLLDEGVRSTECVGLVCHRTIDSIVTLHALRRIGAIAVPVDPDLPEERIDARFDKCSVSHRVDGREVRVHNNTERSNSSRCNPQSKNFDNETEMLCILFTSGTTGEASPVPLTTGNVRSSAYASALRLGLLPTDRWISPMSLAQMGGIAPIYRAVLYGTGTILTPFATSAINDAIQAHEGTGISLVPTMLRKLLEANAPLDVCRIVLVGGDRTDPELVQEALARDVPLYVTYGMTEAASQISTATPAELAETPDTVGRPLRGTTVTTDAEEGEAEGELLVSGPTISPGTFRHLSVDRIDDRGVLHTGDNGYLDASGRLFVTGRIDTRIITGGATVDPQHIEYQIRQLSGVIDAVVGGIPDQTWGEVVGALIQFENEPEDFERSFSALDDILTRAEKPRVILPCEHFPRTPAGTIDRKKAIERLTGATDAEYITL